MHNIVAALLIFALLELGETQICDEQLGCLHLNSGNLFVFFFWGGGAIK